MIQRIQSIFLLLVAIAMGLMLTFDIWQKVGPEQDQAVVLNAYFLTLQQVDGSLEAAAPADVIEQEASWYIAILASLTAVIALYSIFRYDNRLTQMKLGALNSLLIGGTLAICFYLAYQGQQMLAGPDPGQYLIGIYLPAVALVCNALANRFIKKDEALVRSADRFR